MSEKDVVRAWKDRRYRSELSETEATALPQNPAGMVELPHDLLDRVAAAAGNSFCTGTTWGEPCPTWDCSYNCTVVRF